MKCVRNAAKRSYACLIDCPESRFSELLLTAKSCKVFGLRGLRIRKTAFMGRVQAMYSSIFDMTSLELMSQI